MGRTCTLSVDGNGVATVTLENPPVNALHPDGKQDEQGTDPFDWIELEVIGSER